VTTRVKLRVADLRGYATVQDLGRRGFRALGVPVSGALDMLSAAYANALVGNRPGEAVVELFGSAAFEFENDAVVAVTGAEAPVLVDGSPAAMWRPIYVRAGSRLEVEPPRRGSIVYIAVSGGFDCEEVMGSRSTYVRASFGCFGRPLKQEDVLTSLPIDVDVVWRRVQRLYAPDWVAKRIPGDSAVLRATRGVHFDMLPDADLLLRSSYTVTFESDRMGYRLEGPPLQSASRLGRLPSIPVDRGYVQIPPDGEPVVLMSDSQTTGGYAAALHVLPPDVDVLAQCRPGCFVRFTLVEIGEAEEETSRYLNLLEKPVLESEEEYEYW